MGTNVHDGLKKIHKKIENNFFVQIIICIVLCSFVIIYYFILNKKINIKNFRKYTIVEDIKLINNIENMHKEKEFLKLEGYAFYLESNSNNASISVFLKNLKNDKEIWMDTKTILRPDVQNYYNCEYNYENAGYIATTKYNKLIMSDGYEIFINIDTNDEYGNKKRITVSTNRFIYNDKLISYNPYLFDYPDKNIQSELIKKIFCEGQLLFYQKDNGIYVYKYQNKLYWIATNNFQFSKESKTYILYQLWTTQVNKLPKDRIQYNYDKMDFIFEEHEIFDENTSPYRVAVQDIPTDYAITYILTGVYDLIEDNMLWKEYFQFYK